ncbi:MAG: hypothetical protein GDA53_04115 [Rhodobacteraceae bacterium]|nr:hypothetical protein [Paracoccaceae bacterium]
MTSDDVATNNEYVGRHIMMPFAGNSAIIPVIGPSGAGICAAINMFTNQDFSAIANRPVLVLSGDRADGPVASEGNAPVRNRGGYSDEHQAEPPSTIHGRGQQVPVRHGRGTGAGGHGPVNFPKADIDMVFDRRFLVGTHGRRQGTVYSVGPGRIGQRRTSPGKPLGKAGGQLSVRHRN